MGRTELRGEWITVKSNNSAEAVPHGMNWKRSKTNLDLRRINMTVDVYENCPIYENEYYMLRMTNKEDKADLLVKSIF